MTKSSGSESHKELLARLRSTLTKKQALLAELPLGRGGGLVMEIQELESRIKREEIHALSGYRIPRRPVSGGVPGSNRRK